MDQAQMKKMKEELLRDEGFRSFPYKDTTGHLSIGIGHNLSAQGITKDEALYILQNDINECWAELVKLIPWIVNLNTVRQRVIVNLGFNLGVVGLMGFKDMLNKCRLGQFKEASAALLDSHAARQLPSRYARLATQMETGSEVDHDGKIT